MNRIVLDKGALPLLEKALRGAKLKVSEKMREICSNVYLDIVKPRSGFREWWYRHFIYNSIKNKVGGITILEYAGTFLDFSVNDSGSPESDKTEAYLDAAIRYSKERNMQGLFILEYQITNLKVIKTYKTALETNAKIDMSYSAFESVLDFSEGV